eukprot:XP_019924769.1 PREDICTED: ryncolin-1 [Crassostrea gigas]
MTLGPPLSETMYIVYIYCTSSYLAYPGRYPSMISVSRTGCFTSVQIIWQILCNYKNGFGHAEDEYWLGNDAIHALTKDKKQVLRIDLMKFSREKAHATYSSFFVDNEANKYKLSLGGFNGTKGLGDSFAHSNNAYFSTVDVDNDNNKGDCADMFKAGWWFNTCHHNNLNGVYRKASKIDAKEVSWYHWGNTWKSLKSAKMMIRPRQKA